MRLPSWPSSLTSSSLSTTGSRSLPSVPTLAKVFGFGATVGPIVDSLHNQCLLQYDVAPITIPSISPSLLTSSSSWIMDAASLTGHSNLFCSSWIVPPLLGMAYVILGVIMPRLVKILLIEQRLPFQQQQQQQQQQQEETTRTTTTTNETSQLLSLRQHHLQDLSLQLQRTALLAVATTALLILLSACLETSFQQHFFFFDAQQPSPQLLPTPTPTAFHFNNDYNNYFPHDDTTTANSNHMLLLLFKRIEQAILAFLAFLQWAWLDASPSSFVVASLAYVLGPLCELPLIGHGMWHYLPQASDYYPFSFPSNDDAHDALLSLVVRHVLFGRSHDLALSSITGPCYFAVTTDAIAVARWLEHK